MHHGELYKYVMLFCIKLRVIRIADFLSFTASKILLNVKVDILSFSIITYNLNQCKYKKHLFYLITIEIATQYLT